MDKSPIVFSHYSVMLSETVDGLDIKKDGIYVDCTLGGGGHSEEILKRMCAIDENRGTLIGIDRDPDAIEAASARLSLYKANKIIINGNFADAPALLRAKGIEKIDGVVADLGVSSFQLDTAERGFSYMHDAPLDMRMSKQGISAYEIVNTYTEKELSKILFEYGEERFAPKIASAIIERRNLSPIKTTVELSDIIKGAIPQKFRNGTHHPSKKSFQAIRIAVNDELSAIGQAIDGLFEMLNPHGRMSFISFHSLEDRIIKTEFAKYTIGCTCPPDFPVCICGKSPKARLINKKPILPSEKELSENPRSRSAKLRVLEKV